jgi:hypothetical protein
VGEQSITCKGVRGGGFKPQFALRTHQLKIGLAVVVGQSDLVIDVETRAVIETLGAEAAPAPLQPDPDRLFCIIVQRQRDRKVPESKEKARRKQGEKARRKRGESKEEKKTRAPNTSSRAKVTRKQNSGGHALTILRESTKPGYEA